MMRDPRLAEHLLAIPARPFLRVVTELRVRARRLAVVGERMRRGAERDDRLARIHVIDEVLHLVIGPLAKAQQHDAKVGAIERLHARLVVLRAGIDRAGFRVDGKQDRAFEAMPLREDLAQLRQPFLRAILLVARDQDDALPFARAVLSFIDDPLRFIGESRSGSEAKSESGDVEEAAEFHGRMGSDGMERWSNGEMEWGKMRAERAAIMFRSWLRRRLSDWPALSRNRVRPFFRNP